MDIDCLIAQESWRMAPEGFCGSQKDHGQGHGRLENGCSFNNTIIRRRTGVAGRRRRRRRRLALVVTDSLSDKASVSKLPLPDVPEPLRRVSYFKVMGMSDITWSRSWAARLQRCL